MKDYFKYIFMIIIVAFSFYYTDKVFEFSKNNNVVLASIEDYSLKNDTKCIEGYINENGIVLGLSGLSVDKSKSYSNMKGGTFNTSLLEYKKEECILNKKNNVDKYIVSSNNINKNITLIIDVQNKKYLNDFKKVFEGNNIKYNLLVSDNYDVKSEEALLYKGKNIKTFRKKYNEIYCVKNSDYEIINDCKKYKINSINAINYIEKDLYTNMKKLLNNGSIIFIKESKSNLDELNASINYILSRGYNIVSITDALL